MNKSRRKFLQAVTAAGAASAIWRGAAAAPNQFGLTKERTLRIAAVQMTIRCGDVDANLETARRLARKAIGKGASWIVLPEFFTSGYGLGTDPAMLDAHRPRDGEPANLLAELAREAGGGVGGSFLAQRDGDTYNTFVLAMSDGRRFYHDKDAPSTGHEATNYIGGSDRGICQLPDVPLNVGLALCWEMIRFRTACRLRGRVDVVLTGSNYCDSEIFDRGFREKNAQILVEKPGNLARLIGAPVVLANPVGRFSVQSFYDPKKQLDFQYMGRSRITDGKGRTIAALSPGMGEDVLVADVAIGRVEPLDELQDRLWIPDVPDFYNEVFNNDVPAGAEIYREKVRKHRNGM